MWWEAVILVAEEEASSTDRWAFPLAVAAVFISGVSLSYNVVRFWLYERKVRPRITVQRSARPGHVSAVVFNPKRGMVLHINAINICTVTGREWRRPWECRWKDHKARRFRDDTVLVMRNQRRPISIPATDFNGMEVAQRWLVEIETADYFTYRSRIIRGRPDVGSAPAVGGGQRRSWAKPNTWWI